MFIRILGSIAVLVVSIVIAGTSGLIFFVWPTGLHDQKLTITPAVIQRLRDLQSENKFGPDIATFYSGAPSEKQRAFAQASVDSTIQLLINELPARPTRSTVLGIMKESLADFDTPESEERDQILSYFTKILDICEVESSSELFNVWRYGFPYGWIF